MRSFQRPKKPHNFDSVVYSAAADVCEAVQGNTDLKFVEVWREFKPALHTAQQGLCGFCEGTVSGQHFGDVEHFRPKAEISELHDDPALWGREAHGKSSVVGRTLKPTVVRPGYWWLAYEWENYLLSCAVCNQQWKGTLFPVIGTRDRAPDENNEIALLLSPFESFDPADHFIYGRLGEIKGRTARGRATIATCGLDRPSLRLQRQQVATTTHMQLDEIAAGTGDAKLREILLQLRRGGCPGKRFSGMVQAIFGQRSGYKWDQLGALIEALPTQPATSR